MKRLKEWQMKRRIKYTMMVKTVPELSKRDGGIYTCSLGYSDELGFIRVYPLPLNGMKRWSTYEIEVEKNKRDSRAESWKLSSYTRFENFIGFEKDIVYLGDANKDDIINKAMQCCSPSISKLNEQRKSIGFIATKSINAHWQANERFINTKQMGLFEDVEIADFTKYTKETKEKQSRIYFSDGDGSHNLQLNDWQYYEYQRKFGAKPDAFRYINNDKVKLIMIGNLYQYRSKWLALGVFNTKSQFAFGNTKSLF